MQNTVTDKSSWLAARRALLQQEKDHMRQSDALAVARRELPKLKIEKPYSFEGDNGHETLRDLFGNASQLMIYHFMFGPDWEEGCTSCSLWGDNLSGIETHLAHRDVALVFVSTAPFAKVDAYRQRMGWTFQWKGGAGDFNWDMDVKFTPEQVASRTGDYNFNAGGFPSTEAPGLTCFERYGDDIYLTYGMFSRGLEHFNGAYQLLDLAPKGRDEGELPWPMAWLRRRDQY